MHHNGPLSDDKEVLVTKNKWYAAEYRIYNRDRKDAQKCGYSQQHPRLISTTNGQNKDECLGQ